MNDIYLKFPVLNVNEDIFLRQPEFTNMDTNSMYLIYNDPLVIKYVPDGCIPKGIDGAKHEVQHYYNVYDSRNGIYWFVARKSDNVVIGTCGIFSWDRYNQKAEMAYNILGKYHGQGIMTQVINKVVDYAFRNMNLVRLECQLDPSNIGSWRVLEKNGFKKDGILPKYRLYKDNRHIDVLVCSITDEVHSESDLYK